VVWFKPEPQDGKKSMAWPDPGFSATVEQVRWPMLEDPVVKLNAWLRAGGA
jgi:hypothetical protein